MFDKLNKRIFRSIFWLAFAFVVALSIVSTGIIAFSFYEKYTEIAAGNARSGAVSCDGAVRSVTNFVKSASQRSEIVRAAAGEDSENVNRALDTLCNYSPIIAAATLYEKTGARVYYSSETGDVPTLSVLAQNDGLAAFFADGEKETFVSVRKEGIAGMYNSNPYHAENGVISCVCKVYEDGVVKGYLSADILPSVLFAEKLSTGTGEKRVAALVSGDVTVAQESGFDKYFASDKAAASLSDGKWRVFSQRINEDDELRVAVSMRGFYERIAVVMASLAVADALTLTAALVLARKAAANVTTPLDELYIKMQNERINS